MKGNAEKLNNRFSSKAAALGLLVAGAAGCGFGGEDLAKKTEDCFADRPACSTLFDGIQTKIVSAHTASIEEKAKKEGVSEEEALRRYIDGRIADYADAHQGPVFDASRRRAFGTCAVAIGQQGTEKVLENPLVAKGYGAFRGLVDGRKGIPNHSPDAREAAEQLDELGKTCGDSIDLNKPVMIPVEG